MYQIFQFIKIFQLLLLLLRMEQRCVETRYLRNCFISGITVIISLLKNLLLRQLY